MTTVSEGSTNSARWSARLPRMSPVRAFGTVFGAVFLFIFLGDALVTFMLPDAYRASARVIAPGSSDLQVFQSAELLREVSRQLRLPETYAARYGQEQPLKEERVEQLLQRSMQARRLARTDVIEIHVYDRSPTEGAQLANEIAETSVRLTRGRPEPFRILERALPPLKPSRPNKALNLVLGAAVGIFLGIMAGGVGAKLAVGFDSPPGKSA